MKSKDFIYTELKSFIKQFQKTRIRYEYDENALVHVVEVLPNEIYHLDRDYIQWEDNFYRRFTEQFPTENICFISDDALVGVEKPEYILEGLEYAPFSVKETFDVIFTTNVSQSTNGYSNITSYEKRDRVNFMITEIPSAYICNNILNAA